MARERKVRPLGAPTTQSFVEARESLSPELRPIFDSICHDVIEWSRYYYGTKLISYSILKELVQSGWKK